MSSTFPTPEHLRLLPSGWGIRRLKFSISERDQRSKEGKEELFSLSKSRGLLPRSDITEKEARAETLEGYKRFLAGDIVMNKMQAWNGVFGWAGVADGIVSPDYTVLTPDEAIHGPFLTRLLRTEIYCAEFLSRSRGMGDAFLRLNTSELGEVLAPVPPLSEQVAIASYLDAETARIDGLIEEKKKLKALLAELRSATITDAVMGRIDVVTGMARANAEGGGGMSVQKAQLPSGWQLKKLKHVASLQSGEGITSESIEEDGDFPVFGGNGLRGFTRSYTHDGEFVLVGRQGALCGNVHLVHGKFWASEHAVVGTFYEGDSPRWARHVFQHMNLGQYSIASAQPGLAVDRIKELPIAVPPSAVQIAIASYLDAETARIDMLMAHVDREIELFNEFRSATITDAVLGRIDVRDYMKN